MTAVARSTSRHHPHDTHQSMHTLITANFATNQLERLEDELGFEIDYRPIDERPSRLSVEELADLVPDIEVLIGGYEAVTASVMDAAPDLRVIACTRGGPDANVDIAAATERGIPVLYTPGRNAVSVADFTLGLLLGVARNIGHAHYLLRDGTFTGQPTVDAAQGGERADVTWGVARGTPYAELKGPELAGETLGIVGFGAVGRLVAERAAGFDVDVVAYDPYVSREEMADAGVTKATLDELCERSTFVTLHCAVTDATRGLIGAEEFERMPEGAYLVNTARGAIVDQDALLDALDASELAGAALDVYAEEPLPADHPLLARDDVVTTPHIGGASTGVIERHSRMVVDDIVTFVGGEQPAHVANEAALSTAATDGGKA